jgi:hypothetical protein
MKTQADLLTEWYRRVAVTQYAHYLSADHFGARKYWLGVPAILLSTLVGTSVFATIEKQPDLWIRVAVGLASVAAALFASLQTFMGYAERAEKHRISGARYGALGRELEQMRSSGVEYAPETISDLRKRIDDLALEAPNNPLKIYRQAGATEIEVVMK